MENIKEGLHCSKQNEEPFPIREQGKDSSLRSDWRFSAASVDCSE